MMGILVYEGVIDHGQVRLRGDVRLPDNTRVYVVVPGAAVEAEATIYDIDLGEPDQHEGERIVHIYSPHLVPPSRASDFKLEVIEENSDADV